MNAKQYAQTILLFAPVLLCLLVVPVRLWKHARARRRSMNWRYRND